MWSALQDIVARIAETTTNPNYGSDTYCSDLNVNPKEVAALIRGDLGDITRENH